MDGPRFYYELSICLRLRANFLQKVRPDGRPGLTGRYRFAIFMSMESIDFRKLNAARVVICPARDVEAGIVSGSMEYIAYPTMSGQVPTERNGELPELADGIDDGDKFFAALDRAIQSYVDWSARFAYLKKKTSMFCETGFKFMPSHPYKIVMWADFLDEGDNRGYVFSFRPLRDSGKVSAGRVSDDAHSVHVTYESLGENA